MSNNTLYMEFNSMGLLSFSPLMLVYMVQNPQTIATTKF